MNYFKTFFVLFSIIFIGCSSSNTVADSSSELKKNQFRGIIQELNYQSETRSKTIIKDIYFTTEGKNYFIKFSEGYVSKSDALKHLKKEIVVKGEIKYGKWEEVPPTSFTDMKTLKAPRSGEYIVLNKIMSN